MGENEVPRFVKVAETGSRGKAKIRQWRHRVVKTAHLYTQVCVIQEGQKLVVNVMLQESPPANLYYSYRQANLFPGTVLFT